jgi:hypothetical protein
MSIPRNDYPAGSTVYIPFASYNSAGASVTLTGLAVTDVEIYKNGSVTQRASDAGIALLDTDGIDFDGITGLHGFSIDLSDNTDSGFYAVGSEYWVIVSTVTIDSQTVTFIADRFRIVAAESSAGVPKVDVSHVGGTSQTAGDLAALITTVDDLLDTEIAAIKAKTDNLPADPADASDIAALFDALPTAAENATELLDQAAGVETGLTVRQWLRLAASVLFGKASGLATTTAVYRDFGDTKDRITATVDADGNRSAVTRDAT